MVGTTPQWLQTDEHIDSNRNITGATNAAQSLYFRSTDDNLGIKGGNGNYSGSAL